MRWNIEKNAQFINSLISVCIDYKTYSKLTSRETNQIWNSISNEI